MAIIFSDCQVQGELVYVVKPGVHTSTKTAHIRYSLPPALTANLSKTELEIPDYMRRVYAVMAQLAVAIGLGPICWGFESPWRYHIW